MRALLLWMPDADVEHLVALAGMGARDPVALPDAAVLDGDERDDAPEAVVLAIDNEAFERRGRVARRRRDARDDGREDERDAEPGFGRYREGRRGSKAKEGRELEGGCTGRGMLEVGLTARDFRRGGCQRPSIKGGPIKCARQQQWRQRGRRRVRIGQPYS